MLEIHNLEKWYGEGETAGIFSGTDEVIEHITGKPPMELVTYVRAHREAFE